MAPSHVPRNGSPTTTWFEWGVTTNYGNLTPAQDLAGQTSSVALNTAVSGLSSTNTYHFRAVAMNSFGLARGADQSFAHVSARPEITSMRPELTGAFYIQFSGTAGQLYLVIASTDLKDWMVIGEATPLGGRMFEFEDIGDSGDLTRFYAVESP